jgi:hypothetical protein
MRGSHWMLLQSGITQSYWVYCGYRHTTPLLIGYEGRLGLTQVTVQIIASQHLTMCDTYSQAPKAGASPQWRLKENGEINMQSGPGSSRSATGRAHRSIQHLITQDVVNSEETHSSLIATFCRFLGLFGLFRLG